MVGLEVAPAVSLAALEEGVQFRAIAVDEFGGRSVLDEGVVWSAEANRAILDDRGLARGAESGEAIIRASYAGFEAEAKLGVVAHPLVALGLTPETPMVAVGESVHLTVTGTFADDSSAYVTPYVVWQSLDPTLAGIDQAKVTGLVPGRTTMVARVGEVEGRIDVEVTQPSAASLSKSQ
jgi:hypothetical protein